MKLKTLCTTAFTLLPLFAHAEAPKPSYTYGSIAYLTGEIADFDYTGYRADVSVAAGDVAYVLGRYSSAASDDEFFDGFVTDDIEVEQFSFGAGFHLPVADGTDFAADLSWVEAETEAFYQTADADGYLLSAGVRSKPVANAEFMAMLNHAKMKADGESESDTGFTLGARAFVNQNFSAGLSYLSADDADTIMFDLRLSM